MNLRTPLPAAVSALRQRRARLVEKRSRQPNALAADRDWIGTQQEDDPAKICTADLKPSPEDKRQPRRIVTIRRRRSKDRNLQFATRIDQATADYIYDIANTQDITLAQGLEQLVEGHRLFHRSSGR